MKNKKIIIKQRKQILVYIVLASWILMIIAVSYAIVSNTKNAAEIIKAFSKTGPLWENIFEVF